MNLSSTYTFQAPRQVVWDLLIDPTVVAECLPGCESLEPSGEDTYTAVLMVGIASIHRPIRRAGDTRRQGGAGELPTGRRRKGRPGFVRGEARVELADGNDGQTVVSVDGRGQIGGVIARVGQRLVGTVGKTMMDRFFDCLSKKVTAVSS